MISIGTAYLLPYIYTRPLRPVAVVLSRFKINAFYVRIRVWCSDDDRLCAEREMRSVDAIFMEKLLAAPVKDVEASLDCHGTIEDRPSTARNLDDAALQPVDLAVDDWPVETTRLMEKGRRLLAELSTIGETLSSESEIFKRLADLLADGSDTVVGNGPSEPVNGNGQGRRIHGGGPPKLGRKIKVWERRKKFVKKINTLNE